MWFQVLYFQTLQDLCDGRYAVDEDTVIELMAMHRYVWLVLNWCIWQYIFCNVGI